MKKLLHERLRESANECYTSTYTSHDLDELADEIERYYIPRPRFEDGEPVQFGDKFTSEHGQNQTVSSFTYTKGDHGYVRLNGYTKRSLDTPILRYSPKVLDADRVEIKTYETVYDIHSGTRLIVESITDEFRILCKYGDGLKGHYLTEEVSHERPVFDVNGERICKGDTVWDKETGERLTVASPRFYTVDGDVVACKDGGAGELWYKPEELTHREPDSLQKLAQYLDGKYNLVSWELDKVRDRLTALIERGA